jgi:hypothetical protein
MANTIARPHYRFERPPKQPSAAPSGATGASLPPSVWDKARILPSSWARKLDRRCQSESAVWAVFLPPTQTPSTRLVQSALIADAWNLSPHLLPGQLPDPGIP